MGQFKPMVKMETTEPSVILKLKKGGSAKMPKMKADDCGTGHKKMADGGVPVVMEGAPMIKRAAPVAVAKAPARPPMAMRRKAMAVKPALVAAPMKKGGKAEEHEDEAQDRAMIKKALAGKKFATGGVVNGQGGFKDGGIIKSTKGETKVDTTKPDRSPAKTGGVKLGNSGGYATGGVAKANGGGYKKGGEAKSGAKKMADGGRYMGMPSRVKPTPAPAPVNKNARSFSVNDLSKMPKAEASSVSVLEGVKRNPGQPIPRSKAEVLANDPDYAPLMNFQNPYKKGGKAKKYADGGKVQDAGRAVKMPQGNKRPPSPVSINQLSGTYKKGGKVKKYADGGDTQLRQNQDAYKQWEADERKFNEGLRSDVQSAVTYPFRKGKELFDKLRGQGAVTDTERTVSRTVVPAKKRGGKC